MMPGMNKYLSLVAGKPKKPRAKPRDLEGPVQRAIIAGLAAALPMVQARHIPNGGMRNKRVAQKLKADGVKPGTHDLYLTWPGGTGWIEVKAPGGKPTPEQLQFGAELNLANVPWAVCDNVTDAIETVRKWL